MSSTLFALATAALCTGCAALGGNGVSQDIADITRSTKTGGELAFEIAADGTIIGIDAEIDSSQVPRVRRKTADRHCPGGKLISAEQEWNAGKPYRKCAWDSDGKRLEILMNAEGSLAGHVEALQRDETPNDVIAVARAAVPGGKFVVAERVSDTERKMGEEYHVKIDVGGGWWPFPEVRARIAKQIVARGKAGSPGGDLDGR